MLHRLLHGWDMTAMKLDISLMDDVCTDMLNLFKHYYAGLLWSFGSDGS